MNTLIPVVIILGVLGFIVWKNWAKIVQLSDKFTNRGQEPEVNKPEPAQPESGAPYKVPEGVLVTQSQVVAIVDKDPQSWEATDAGEYTEWKPADPVKPAEVNTGSDNWLTRANKPTDEVAAYRDGLVESMRDAPAFHEIFPDRLPNFLLGEPTDFRQAVLTLDVTPVKFWISVPAGWTKTFNINTSPHPSEDKNGDAWLYFRLTDKAGTVYAKVTVGVQSGNFFIGKGKASFKLPTGTYFVELSTDKPCKTIVACRES